MPNADTLAKKMRANVQRPSDACLKLQELIGLGKTSLGGLRQLVKTLDHRELNNATDIKLANAALFESIKHVEIMPLRDGGQFDWNICHPCSMFARLVEDCASLRELVAAVAIRNGNAPWKLIVGYDEYVPGDWKRPEPSRKSMNVFFSFLDFGAENLCLDALWFIPVSLRSHAIALVDGGWSRMFTRFLDIFLWGPRGVQTAGIPLVLNGSPYLLKAQLEVCISDGMGLAQALEWRGAGSIKPCFFHSNVLKRNCRLSREAGDEFVEIHCNGPTRFRRTELHDLYDDVDSILQLRHLVEATPRMLDNMCYVTGIAATVHGLLASPRVRANLDVRKVFHLDWAHTLLQDGTLTNDLSLFMRNAEHKLGIDARFWESNLKDGWKFPSALHQKHRHLWKMFNEYRIPEGAETHVKGSMTEILGLYSLVRHIVATTAAFNDPTLHLERTSLMNCCVVVDLFLMAKRRRAPARDIARRLRQANSHHMASLVAAYGTSAVKPKNHWVFDLADQIERGAELNFVPDTLALERLHIIVKRVALRVRNTRVFEKSVLATLCLMQKQSLLGQGGTNNLRGHTHKFAADVTLGRSVAAGGMHVKVGDVVFHRDGSNQVAVIEACARVGNHDYFLVTTQLSRPTALTLHAVQASLTGGRSCVMPLADAVVALAWYEGGDSTLVALK
jgi:hypothetical protein